MAGRRMAAARALWRANGMKDEQMGQPVIAIVNSFTQFVPGHTHLHQIGQIVKEEISKLGCYAAEFNTIAIDDGIAMGHDGMLYSLPSRDLIADSVEYMVNAHKADAMICISNCDKITPGMLMAAMRLNIPAVFISGGPMEAGRVRRAGGKTRDVDLINVMIESADDTVSDAQVAELEAYGCPTCGSCSGMFTANSMNSLTEAIGLALPGNGTVVATHSHRIEMFRQAARLIVKNARAYYENEDASVLPRSIVTREAMLNAMALDIAMGGSTNTVLHLLAVGAEGGVDFSMADIDALSRRVGVLCKVAPNHHYHIQDVNRAGGIPTILKQLLDASLIDGSARRVDGMTVAEMVDRYAVAADGSCASKEAEEMWHCAPGGVRSSTMGSQSRRYEQLDTDRAEGCIRDVDHAYVPDGGIAVLTGNIAPDGCVVKTAGVDPSIFKFSGPVKVFESQEEAVEAILSDKINPGDVVAILYEGPKGGPGMQEMLYPTSYLKSKHLGKECALLTDGRFSGGTSGLSIGHISPEAAAGGPVGLLRDGDIIEIDIPARRIDVRLSADVLAARRREEEARGAEAFTPRRRQRSVSKALQAYAAMVTSADKGGVRTLK